MNRRRPGRLPHRRIQTGLAIAALASAVALPVVLLSVGGGVYSHELASLNASGYQLTVTSHGVHGVDGSHRLSEQIRGLPTVAFASPVLSNAVEIFGPKGVTPALAEGVIPGQFLGSLDPTEAALFPHPLRLGDPGDTDQFANGTYRGASAGTVLISAPLMVREGLSIGDPVSLSGDADPGHSRAFAITGVFGATAPGLGATAVFGVVLPLSDLQLLVGVAEGPEGAVRDASDTLQVALTPHEAADPSAVAAVASAIRQLVPYYTVTTVGDEAVQLQATERVLTGFYLGLSAVGLCVGSAFLALLLLREVEVERRGIGIRRALGVPPRQIVLGLLARGYLLALAGTLVGIVAGIALVAGLAGYGGGNVAEVARLAVFDPLTLASLGLLVIGLSGVAGLYAGRVVLRRPIPELLR